jgi:hypothetical protein
MEPVLIVVMPELLSSYLLEPTVTVCVVTGADQIEVLRAVPMG